MAIKLEDAQTNKCTTASPAQFEARNQLWELFKQAQLPEAELERNLGLFIRGPILARFLAIDDVYKRIVNTPGVIFDFGCWRGQTTVLCENLRAIHEPFNKYRRVISCDTFAGYTGTTEKDAHTDPFHEQTYTTGDDYPDFLQKVLTAHEGNNVLGHITGCHRILKGDITVTLPKYFEEHPETLISLAFFDLGLYEPTKFVLKNLLNSNRILPGTVFAFYQLTRDEFLPGESIAFQEMMPKRSFKIEKSRYYPTLSILTFT